MAGLSCGAALAQDTGLSVSVGARAWYTQWTTFSYLTDENDNNIALTQVSADEKFVLVPLLSVRYGNFVGAMSLVPSTRFHFLDGGSGTRREFDLNLGYSVLPGLNVTLGYKKVSQRDGDVRYEPSGPVLGVYGSAPLASGFSLYGSLGLGRLKTPQSGGDDVVKFKADYRLTEVGLAYALAGEQMWPRWTFTAGYRFQVMSSKAAFGSQDGRDTTQGVAVGAVATF
ncbi:MAG: hypothetical protein HYZ20_17230 [Burkholderiales bacterium]|nr:hypothetical protein [Burkholderiales bacterium]